MDWWILYQLILALGAVQGLILGAILFFSASPKRQNNRYLAALLFFFSYRLIVELLKSLDLVRQDSWTYHVFLEYNWIYGALIYFFVLTYVQPNFKWSRKDLLHFLPVGIEFLFSNWVKIQNFYWDGSRESLSWLGAQSYILWMHTPFAFLVALGLIIWYVRRAQLLLQDEQPRSNSGKASIQWLQNILKVYFYFSIIIMLVLLIDFLFFDYAFNPFYPLPTYIGLAGITYWLALEGYARRNDASLKKAIIKAGQLDQLKSIIPRLEALMQEEQLFLNPELNLRDLAERLSIKPHHLSQALNRILQKNFNDYINAYRVNEAIRLMNHPDYAHYSLMAIALESGFNSKATFNRIFKKIKGQAPSRMKE